MVTTPLGSEGMYEQTLDDNWAIKRLQIDNTDEFGDKRFYKPIFEPFKSFNQSLVEYYSYKYLSRDNEAMKKIKFGGSFHNLSKLIR